MERIVSLIASATEIVCALGFRSRLVGRSHECDFPESIKTLPVLTRPKFPINVSSLKMDRQVKTLLKQGLSIYEVNVDKLRELNPTAIVTQVQCEVCAVSLKDVERALWQWLGQNSKKATRPKIISLNPNNLSDLWADIHRTAQTLGRPKTADALVAQLKKRMQKIIAKAENISQRPTVAAIEWIDPLMSAGNWMPELIEMAGGVNLFGKVGQHSPYMSWEELINKNPDIILIIPCGYNIKKTRQEFGHLIKKSQWLKLRAVKMGDVYLADGNQYFNRPGPRLVESLEILAEIFHPQIMHFGHEGEGWERWAKNF